MLLNINPFLRETTKSTLLAEVENFNDDSKVKYSYSLY